MKPMKWGGLAIRKAREQNIGPLGKLIWDSLHSHDKLWIQLTQSIRVIILCLDWTTRALIRGGS